tara:strand:- start:2539 stop:2952 length:414 start_codon:yes stop_codon:yes gene_type:complete
MATQIVIANEESINMDNGSYVIEWVDKGNAMPSLPSTIHFVIWNNLVGQNEIQNKDANGNMIGNTNLSSTGDAVESTTVSALLTWAETRKGQIETAKTTHDSEYETALTTWLEAADENTHDNFVWNKTWITYDSNYS